jgi:hypothetical protein
LEKQPERLQQYYEALEKNTYTNGVSNTYTNGVSFLDKPTGKNLNNEQIAVLLATTLLTAEDTHKRCNNNTSQFTYYDIINAEGSNQKSLQLNED